MGENVEHGGFTYADRRKYRDKLQSCMRALRAMTDEDRFDTERTLTGVELELNLVGDSFDPAMTGQEVLSYLTESEPDDGLSIQDELGKYNLELNLAPRSVSGTGLAEYETELRGWLAAVAASAEKAHSSVVLVGTLPTVRHEHARVESLSPGARYHVLNEQILSARGEEISIDIAGAERLRAYSDSIAPESANTSVQFHIQLTPRQFPRYWNAAQALAGPQLATAANAPYLFGAQLWAETRIILFEQATDIRSGELRVQGVRPRTFFGEHWISSVLDLFEENLRYFVPLLPICDAEDPLEVLRGGGTPQLAELRLHNGTVYRWNRPVYDVGPSGAHLRVENRVLPSGPTPVDICANMAFYYGSVVAMAEAEEPIWTKMPFSVAEQNFHSAARHGIDATQVWPGYGELSARTLVREHLLPLARRGLKQLGADPVVTEPLLSIIEGRCDSGVNGAAWQTACVGQLEREGMSRADALREMLRRYSRHAATNTPVHEWEQYLAARSTSPARAYARCVRPRECLRVDPLRAGTSTPSSRIKNCSRHADGAVRRRDERPLRVVRGGRRFAHWTVDNPAID